MIRKHTLYLSFISILLLSAFSVWSQSGSEVWLRRAPGLDGEDRITAMAKDADGNIYVTGYSWNIASGFDYLTIKYDAAGTELWRARYDNTAVHGDDHAATIGVRDVWLDKELRRYVWVSGKSQGGGTGMDYASVLYDAETGAPSSLWADLGAGTGVRRFDGNNRDDEARALTVDAWGTVYVTGWVTLDQEVFPRRVFGTISYLIDGTANPYWPARPYDPALFQLGEPQGVRYYTWSMERIGGKTEEATAIALYEWEDKPYYVHVTGRSYGPHGYGYATIKYNIWDGEESEQWPALDYDNRRGVRRWDDPLGSGHPRAITVDSNAQVFVTGSVRQGCSGTIFCEPPKSLSSTKGISFATSCSQYGTVKYAADGRVRWQRRYHPFGDDENRKLHDAMALTLDADEQVYVTGYSNRINTVCPVREDDHDWLTVKYRSSDEPDDGAELWVRREIGPISGSDVHDAAFAIAADNSNGIYITGGTAGFWQPDPGLFERFTRMTTRKYDARDGLPLWSHHYEFSQGGYFDSCGKAIAVIDNPLSKETDGVYSAGYSFGYDFLTVKIYR